MARGATVTGTCWSASPRSCSITLRMNVACTIKGSYLSAPEVQQCTQVRVLGCRTKYRFRRIAATIAIPRADGRAFPHVTSRRVGVRPDRVVGVRAVVRVGQWWWLGVVNVVWSRSQRCAGTRQPGNDPEAARRRPGHAAPRSTSVKSRGCPPAQRGRSVHRGCGPARSIRPSRRHHWRGRRHNACGQADRSMVSRSRLARAARGSGPKPPTQGPMNSRSHQGLRSDAPIAGHARPVPG
jgi:hypothetical protein